MSDQEQPYGLNDRCETCGEWIYSKHHRCPPRWEVRAEDETEWRVVWAQTAEEAAEKFTEEYENNYADYSIAGGRSRLNVLVLDSSKPPATPIKFKVTGETLPHYTAEVVEIT